MHLQQKGSKAVTQGPEAEAQPCLSNDVFVAALRFEKIYSEKQDLEA